MGWDLPLITELTGGMSCGYVEHDIGINQGDTIKKFTCACRYDNCNTIELAASYVHPAVQGSQKNNARLI